MRAFGWDNDNAMGGVVSVEGCVYEEYDVVIQNVLLESAALPVQKKS